MKSKKKGLHVLIGHVLYSSKISVKSKKKRSSRPHRPCPVFLENIGEEQKRKGLHVLIGHVLFSSKISVKSKKKRSSRPHRPCPVFLENIGEEQKRKVVLYVGQ